MIYTNNTTGYQVNATVFDGTNMVEIESLVSSATQPIHGESFIGAEISNGMFNNPSLSPYRERQQLEVGDYLVEVDGRYMFYKKDVFEKNFTQIS